MSSWKNKSMRRELKRSSSPVYGGGDHLPRRAFISALAAAALLRPRSARAQLSSTRPIRIIVPFAPAGSSDVLARLLQSPLQQALNQTVIVENRAGAGATIGMVEAVLIKPEGCRLGLTSSPIADNPGVDKIIGLCRAKNFDLVKT